jgi:hypothetical protein
VDNRHGDLTVMGSFDSAGRVTPHTTVTFKLELELRFLFEQLGCHLNLPNMQTTSSYSSNNEVKSSGTSVLTARSFPVRAYFPTIP